MFSNFTFQDIFGSLLAFAIFPLVFFIPGYVFSEILNLFEFRQRFLPARLAIAVVISLSITPIMLFLFYRLVSADGALLFCAIFVLVFAGLLWFGRKNAFRVDNVSRKNTFLAGWIFSGWSLFAIFSLVDIQWGNRLYYSVVSNDLTTRVSIVDAITRTGVPPISPGFFAGEPMRLTFLYYFWYIPCSLVDRIGGGLVDARMAMIASVAWCGIGLMSIIALYLRLRNPWNGLRAWKTALMGIGALTISGLDCYPALVMMIGMRLATGRAFPEGDIEHWNEQITAWVSALYWVPHHVASLIACLVGFLLVQSVRGKGFRRQLGAAIVAGLAFASAAGMSIWVTAVFVLFWGMWMVYLLVKKREIGTVLIMVGAGVIAVAVLSPFLLDLLGGGSSMQGGRLPVIFEVRLFRPVWGFVLNSSVLVRNLVFLVFLPIKYILELGFYLAVGWFWLRRNARNAGRSNPYHVPEILLLTASVFVGTFLRSSLINNNDLGWRGWMFGQFILLVWAVDIGQEFLAQNSFRTYLNATSKTWLMKRGRLLAQLVVFGVFTTILSVVLLRTWTMLNDTGLTGVPNGLSLDTRLGERTFAARQAYEFVRDQLPENVVIQYNPALPSDHPSGLYGTRQMVLSDHSAYGVTAQAIDALQLGMGVIFKEKTNDWARIDPICAHYSIDVLVMNDLDPIWQALPGLSAKRPPLYRNAFYALFACGKFAGATQ
jgi:hypothetical protein